MTDIEMASLRAAYVMLLQLPHNGTVRHRLQMVLATLRDEIAAGQGKTAEEVQNYFEALVSMTLQEKVELLSAERH